MKAKITTSSIVTAIKEVQKVTNNAENLSFEFKKEGLSISSSASGRSIKLNVDGCEVEKPGKFTVKATVILGIMKNRKELELLMKNDNSVSFKSVGGKSSYTGEIILVPYEEVTIEPQDTNLVKLNSSSLGAVESLLGKVGIVSIYQTEVIPLHISMSSNGMEASCYDNFHLAYSSDSELKAKQSQSFSLPPDTLSVINSQAKSKGYAMSIGESVIYAYNKDFELKLPLEQSDTQSGISMAEKFMKSVKEVKPNNVISADLSNVTTILDNVVSVHEAGVPLVITLKGDTLSFKLESAYGKVVDSLKVTVKAGKDAEYKCDPDTVADLLSKLKGKEVVLKFIKNRCLFIETKDEMKYSFYSCGLL